MAFRRRGGLVSIDQAWNSVSLEERMELISRAQASGVLATLASMLLMGCIAYGFDQIWLLAVGVAGSSFVFPLFSSYSWRREKPALILAYLAVRTVARRYAFAYNIPDLDIVFIYRGQIREIFRDRADEEMRRQQMDVELDDTRAGLRSVWIVLMRAGIVCLSERDGGAKLEFLTALNHESRLRKATNEDNPPNDNSLVVEGAGSAKGRTLLISSRYPAAHYVFEKKILGLIEEQKVFHETQERLRAKAQAA